MHLLIANRGEIALRISRTARELGIETTAVHASDDRDGGHVRMADHVVTLPGRGAAAYQDAGALIDAARSTGADSVHPGYGFLSESAEFAEACLTSGLTFVGPAPSTLRALGNKISAREAAAAAGVPVPAATRAGADVDEMADLLSRHSAVMVKAVAGGGGRGIRAVRDPDELEDACKQCAAEALAGFGDGSLFAESLVPSARHIEIQVVGDGHDVAVIGDRDCSLQRRHQKLIEVAPAQNLAADTRRDLHAAASRLVASLSYTGLGTVEFLVTDSGQYYFLEVNPRIQVEHPITEAVTGVDLVAVSLRIAAGSRLSDLGLESTPESHGIAVEARVNAEHMDASGVAVPGTGTITAFTPPTGPGVRVDTHLRPGATVGVQFDPLLAKVIIHSASGDLHRAYDKAARALDEFVCDGVPTNLRLLTAILRDDDYRAGLVDTAFLTRRLVDFADAAPSEQEGPTLSSPMPGVVVQTAEAGASYPAGAALVTIEAMKMRHVVTAPYALVVQDVLVQVGRNVEAGESLATIRRVEPGSGEQDAAAVDLDAERADLAEVRALHRIGSDDERPEAVARRRSIGRRTARENIADLVDPDSFTEYGPLVVAAQGSRYSTEHLRALTPADGLVAGVATVGGVPIVVMSYDYSVLAGTQGARSHAKTDRMIRLARDRRLPVVLFPEGGGGRPGDVDAHWLSGLDVLTFHAFGALRGRVPLIAVVSGRCFAGNAALAGMCDVVVATPDTTIGMAGPALIEGGGLGTFAPDEIGPVAVQRRNGVLDVVAADEAAAVAVARRCLGIATAQPAVGAAPDPRVSRSVIPGDRMHAYDVRAAILAVADVGSVIELQADHAPGIITCFIRVDGRSYGLVANDCRHLGGAIDVAAARKMRSFLDLCDSWRLPVVSFCDTPGFMVGPASEAEGAVRAFADLFVAGARLTVPLGTVILRKGYGLGAQAMAGGSFHAADFVVAWPTGEIGMMGLEGAVRLGFRKELDAEPDDAARQALFDKHVTEAYAAGRANHAASAFEIDDVIDPAHTRAWISTLQFSNDSTPGER